MAKRGRPPKHSDDQMTELVASFEKYIEETDIPIVAEFAYQNGLYKNYFYEHDEFTNLIKRATSKKEAALERGSLTGTLNPTQAIFSLKQMGWTDKQHLESINTNNNLNQDVGGLSPEERRARIDELNRRRGNGTSKSS